MSETAIAPKYTADWVRAKVAETGSHRLNHHDCGFCGYMTAYLFHDGEVAFDPGCDCTGGAPYRLSSYDDVARWLAMQSSDEIRDGIMARLA